MLVNADVARPQVLCDWSTVGSTSVSVVWRCNSNVRNMDAFLLYYRPLDDAEMRRHAPPSLDPTRIASLTEADLGSAGFSRVRIHRFVSKRSQAVVRDLKPATNYVLLLFAVNQLARSPPSVFFFQTSVDEGAKKRILSRRRPVGLPLCDKLAALAGRIFRAVLTMLLFCYVVISALVIIVYRDTVYNDLCYALSWSPLSDAICPVGRFESLKAGLHSAQEAWYSGWMNGAFSNFVIALSSFNTSLFK